MSSRRALTVAAALLCAAAAGTVAFTLSTLYRLHVPLPYWDEWYTVIHFRRFAEGGYGLADLAAQHNEHRLLFPRLFFFVDELAFGLSGVFDATVTVLLQSVNAGILIVLMRRTVARPVHRLLLAAFVLLLLFTLRQEENFTNGFQLQFVGVFTAAALAGVAYAAALDRVQAGRTGSVPFFVLAAVGCGVSTYTMANGVLAGLVLTAIALLRRAAWPVPVATAAFAAALAALFFHDYAPGGGSLPLSHALTHPLLYLRFVAAYLGNPLDTGLPATQALGACGLALAAGAAWRVARARSPHPAHLALLALAGFVLASAAATAYGRIALGTEQALESRYATPSLLFWCALVVFWFPAVVGPARRWTPAVALGAVMALLAVAAVSAEAIAWPPLAVRSAAMRRVSDSLLAGLYDPVAAGAYEVTPQEDIAGYVPFLRAHRLAAFADPDSPGLGKRVDAAAQPSACDGTVAAAADPALGPDGVRLSGRVVDAVAGHAPRRVLVMDASGTLVGFGSASLPGEPSRLWTGYARAKPGEVLHAAARLGGGALCAFGAATVAGAPPPP